DKIFDYVVVGGGTAGLTSAARLAEGSSHSIAVIEAGGLYEQDNVVPFSNSTNEQNPEAWSSTGGPLQISHGGFVEPFATWVQPAAKKLGLTGIDGFQSDRLSLAPKSRLQVYHHTLAEKVLLDQNNAATGVQVSSNSTTFTLKARKEVLLSAGAFQSPQLLMLSGIGPAATLAEHNIPLRIDLPSVGSNLQDHPFFGSQHRVAVPPSLPPQQSRPLRPRPPSLRQPRQLELLPVNAALGYNRNYQTEDPLDGYNYATLATSLVAPLSRGTMAIPSANPADPPVIDPAYLTHPADAELAVAAMRRQREFWAEMKGMLVGEETLPGDQVESDGEILRFVKESLAPTWHAAGTCRMGRKEDTAGSVADSTGRVHGARGLRVVDASVFPVLVPGHIQATVYAVAEKIAEGILRGERCSSGRHAKEGV
ncbi:MAG: hypothetical protein LQ338_007817, partial [Usnochroma carphineum]